MPAVSATQIGVATLAVIVGLLIGWAVRSSRCSREKRAINAGWQEQIEAQRIEHGRLLEQNKSLMDQISQFRATNSEATRRAGDLAKALKEALGRRDDLQRELKSARGNLELAVEERRQLESDIHKLTATDDSLRAALGEKDEKIFNLSRELDSWHKRLPPLIERFRDRNEAADRLKLELREAREKATALESALTSDQTRVEPVDPQALTGGLNASNDTLGIAIPADIAETDSSPDDLKQIKGIGPAIEKTLNELGIFSFGQIAALSEYEIDRVASRLRGFRTRIYREDWIGQARELQQLPPGNE